MIWRIDEILRGILEQLGAIWLVAALAVLIYVAFGRLVRSLLVAVLVLICTQLWNRPDWMEARVVAMWLRWWLLFILFVRGVIFIQRASAVPGEAGFPRKAAAALGCLAIASCLWSDTPDYAISLAISFCFGLVVAFGLLWRLLDQPDAIPTLVLGALWFGLLAFGAGFALAGWGLLKGDHRVLDELALGYGMRYNGIFLNANANGLMAAMTLPIVAAAPREFLGRAAALRLPVCALTAATVFLSGSRSAVIGSLLAFSLLAVYRFRVGAALAILLACVGGAAFVVYAPYDDETIDASVVGQISRTKGLSTLSGRVELWEMGWAEAQGHMLVGQGWGHSRTMGGMDAERASTYGYSGGATNLHNAHLQLLIDVGVVGIAVFWSFCAFVFLSGRSILLAPRTSRNAFALVIFASALGMLADTWVHGSVWSMGNPTTLIFWGLCAVAIKEGDRARRMTIEARDADSAWRTGAPAAAA